ncbi:hypothetical protein [Nonomuraea monospora]
MGGKHGGKGPTDRPYNGKSRSTHDHEGQSSACAHGDGKDKKK